MPRARNFEQESSGGFDGMVTDPEGVNVGVSVFVGRGGTVVVNPEVGWFLDVLSTGVVFTGGGGV